MRDIDFAGWFRPPNAGDDERSSCVLMFSGGRDSAIAAVRLADKHSNLILVTVTSEHLVGIGRVRSRLLELHPVLPTSTVWCHVVASTDISDDILLHPRTCLPCHRSYAAIGVLCAKSFGVDTLAFGYAGYQSHWPEQTPEATRRLARVLATGGRHLSLPVYDLRSKEAAILELERYGLSSTALEQKCLKQVTNVTLSPAVLDIELSRWEHALERALYSTPSSLFTTVTQITLRDIATLPASHFE